MTVFKEFAPAKINLTLKVLGKRPDGYHELESLVAFAAFGDYLTLDISKPIGVTVSGPFAGSIAGENLLNVTLRRLREAEPQLQLGAVTLEKNLPVAAGIGGGSADAAAALRMMASLSNIPVALADLADMAARLGADVPACLVSAPLVARGGGEVLTRLPEFPSCHIVLVNPLIPLATADVFRRLRAHDNYPLPELPSPLTRPAQLGIWLAETRNDLQPPAVKLVPVIGEIVEELGGTQGCILARMSGSGATVFGLFGSAGQAHQAAQVMRASHPDHWVAAAPLLVS